MDLFTRVRDLVAEVLQVPAQSLDASSGSSAVPEWDSLQHLNVIAVLEQELSVRLPDEEATNAETLGDLVQAVSRAKAREAA